MQNFAKTALNSTIIELTVVNAGDQSTPGRDAKQKSTPTTFLKADNILSVLLSNKFILSSKWNFPIWTFYPVRVSFCSCRPAETPSPPPPSSSYATKERMARISLEQVYWNVTRTGTSLRRSWIRRVTMLSCENQGPLLEKGYSIITGFCKNFAINKKL